MATTNVVCCGHEVMIDVCVSKCGLNLFTLYTTLSALYHEGTNYPHCILETPGIPNLGHL